MNFRPTEAQRLLLATAREFLRARCPVEVAQALAADARGFSDDLWRGLAELGWAGLLVPGALGGSDGSVLEVVLLVEAMGWAGLPGPYVPSAVVATSMIVAGGSELQKKRLLPAMALGERRCTLALAEASAAPEPEAIALDGEAGGRLRGAKLFVRDAHVAHDLIVIARGGGGLNALLLEADRPGIGRRPMATMSGEKLFEVTFADVPVRAGDLLGSPGRGWDVVAPALRLGALARAAEMVGGAQRVLELAVEHAKVRVQSGRPIGSFQAIQHACADSLRDVETTRGLVHHAAWVLAEGREGAAEVAMAKWYAGARCLDVARRAHQTLGAIGYCEEHPLHLFHKRIQAASVDFGDAALHAETVARAIGLGEEDR